MTYIGCCQDKHVHWVDKRTRKKNWKKQNFLFISKSKQVAGMNTEKSHLTIIFLHVFLQFKVKK